MDGKKDGGINVKKDIGKREKVKESIEGREGDMD